MSKTVFISYSHDSEPHKKWVCELATFLREKGIDVVLDQWDVEFGDDLEKFMENSIKTSERVVVISTDEYIRKANEGIGGVGYETTICTAEMLNSLRNRRKFIPVVRNVSGEQKLPTFFGAAQYLDLSDGRDNQEMRNELVRSIYEIPRTKPALGSSPFIPNKAPPKDEMEIPTERPKLGQKTIIEFGRRFSQAFPGLRGVEWFEDSDTIAERLEILLRQPLAFEEGDVAWWWRGPSNLQIQRFERVEDRHFLMDIEELNIRRIAAINMQNVYYRKYVYVETNADEPTGLYPANEEDVKRRITTTGYDYEEYGLVDGMLPVTRAEYEDDAAIIEGKPVEIIDRVVLRTRYTTPYNFFIAPNESPINNSQFDNELEKFLNQMLQGVDVFDNLYNSVQQLPRVHR